jgi:hypothetical protein
MSRNEYEMTSLHVCKRTCETNKKRQDLWKVEKDRRGFWKVGPDKLIYRTPNLGPSGHEAEIIDITSASVDEGQTKQSDQSVWKSK